MEAIDASLPAADGVAWFNKLYLAVTRAVHDDLAEATFADARFLARLDVVFANLYLRTLDPAKKPPRAWAPLLTCRRRKGIAPIRFAFAGMNAHINYDLPVALAQTCRDLARATSRRSTGPSASRAAACFCHSADYATTRNDSRSATIRSMPRRSWSRATMNHR